MSAKTIGIILGGFVAGVVGISFAMLGGSGWETPGTYTGISNAAHTVNNTSTCYAFQTGCSVTSYGGAPTSADYSGQSLSGNYQGGP